jgi:serine/threonine protein kinase
MLKQLKHRNIVKFYDAQRQNDGLYIFLEYVSQVSLKKVLQNTLMIRKDI